MAGEGVVVNLLQNRLYPTYQLYALMANGKTAVADGLKLGALITMRWLRRRLGDHVPEEIKSIPDVETFREVDVTALKSVHINRGYVVDIVSLLHLGTWSMQITEPDLGSAPGQAEQSRAAVPGRIIETNVAYHIAGKELECGFKIIVSDPEGTPREAEVYRLAIVRELLRHPSFGLKQVVKLEEKCARIASASQVKDLLSLWKNSGNQMPCVVFSQPGETPTLAIDTAPKPDVSLVVAEVQRPWARLIRTKTYGHSTSVPEPYDADRIAKSLVAFSHTYYLEAGAMEKFRELSSIRFRSGDIIIMEPHVFGGATTVLPYQESAARREETVAFLKERIMAYPRGKEVDYGNIPFLSAARESLMDHLDAVSRRVEGVNAEWEQTIEILRAEVKGEIEKRNQENQMLREQLSRQRAYQLRLEKEKDELREIHTEQVFELKEQLAAKDGTIAYLRRKLSQPRDHQSICDWASDNFSDKLILHERAIGLLKDKSAQSVNVGLICDALDFLATDYWERRYLGVSTEEMNSRCSEKYGRPFEVKPVGNATITYTPSQYRIMYYPDANGNPTESDLNYHLRVGNDPENLLRIYFLHDDAKRKIVIGSLPKHLRSISIQ